MLAVLPVLYHISLWLMYFRHRSWFQLPTDLKSICFMFNSDSTTFTEHLWVLVCIISGVLIHHLSFGYKGAQEHGGGPRKGSRDQGSSDVLPPCSEHTLPARTTGPPGILVANRLFQLQRTDVTPASDTRGLQP